jgi:hypothetical protein
MVDSFYVFIVGVEEVDFTTLLNVLAQAESVSWRFRILFQHGIFPKISFLIYSFS